MQRYVSPYRATPIKDGDFSEKIQEIRALLKQYENSGRIASFDGIELAYSCYLCANPVGNIVIVHGYTEFAAKYEEIIYYFLQNGYNCFIYDQRTHGHSGSSLENRSYNHVENFREYSKDLDRIMNEVVRPNAEGKPISFYSHSMGGCVLLLYFHDFQPADIQKAVLSSPMIKPRMSRNLPFWLVKSSIMRSVKKDGWDAPFPHTPHFKANVPFNASFDLSPARFKNNLSMRCNDPMYQNSGSTNRWLYECMYIHKEILKEDFLSAITPEILILRAGRDTVVYTDSYEILKQYLPSCRISEYPDSRHSIYNSDDETLVRYWAEVFRFLSE